MTFDEIVKRTAARKAAGVDQTYPQHAGKSLQRVPLSLVPCTHLGARVPGQPCGSPLLRCNLHKVVTARFAPCIGAQRCCATCDDDPAKSKRQTAPAPPRDPWANPVLVPQPPAYTGAVTSSRAIVTVVTGASGRAMWEVSGPLMRAYAARLGADLVVLDWPGHPDWPMSAKFAVGPVVEHYERLIYADADVLFRPGCLDLFGACDPGELGGYSDLAEVMRFHPEFAGEYQRLCRVLTGEPTALPWYINTGVLVLSRQHAPLLSTPTVAIPPLHCSEQHWWVRNVITSGVPVKLLPRVCNWQFWVDKWSAPIPPEAVIHVSGWPGSLAARVAEMRRLTALN